LESAECQGISPSEFSDYKLVNGEIAVS
jgi:hypothetical protein